MDQILNSLVVQIKIHSVGISLDFIQETLWDQNIFKTLVNNNRKMNKIHLKFHQELNLIHLDQHPILIRASQLKIK